MNNEWWAQFGFTGSPYGTKALSDAVGDSLLAGRDIETDWLSEKLTNYCRVPILFGDNGVGKTSIANVVGYRLQKQFNSGNKRFFVLERNEIHTTELNEHNLEKFESSLFHSVIGLLLQEKSFLIQRGISRNQICEVEKYTKQIIFVERSGGVNTPVVGGSYSHGENPNPSAERQIVIWAKEWLRKCFSNSYSGGIICVIDNLENYGTSKQVKRIVEHFRDTLFAIPGLLWVLCGTRTALKGVLASGRLEGHIVRLEIEPVDEFVAPDLIKRRLDYYADSSRVQKPPVNQPIFHFIYETVTNRQLRTALNLCEDFSYFLSENTHRADDDRKATLRSWLLQRVGRLTGLHSVSEESWKAFDTLALNLGGACYSSDAWLVNDSYNATKLKMVFETLLGVPLVEEIEVDDGFMLRLNTDGWLVNYKRQTEGND